MLLDAPQTIGNLVFGDSDPGSTGNWIVDDGGNPGNTLTLAAAGAPTLTVNALGADAAARLAAPLAGTAGLTKIGPGPLVLDRINTLTGAINVNGGTLRLDPGSSLNTGTGTVNVGVTAGVRLQVNGGSLSAGGLVTIGSGTGGGNVGALFTLDSGTATFGAVRTNSDSGSTIRVNGGTFAATDVNIRRNSAGTPDFGSGFIVNGGAATVGTIGLGTNNSNGALTVAGGSLVATGTVTIGNQATAGRGGAMRVIGGTFTSTDTVNGVVLARTSGTNANNVASAAFTGGVSTVEKITLGFDATVTAGSATLTVNGGTLYLGAGGIVRNGAGTFASTLNFSAGTVGAKSNWSTSLPIALPSGGNVVFKAGDASDLPRDITLTGGLSGAGGLTKAGLGTLVLPAANTFTGPVGVNAGVLRVDGSLAPGDLVSVNGGGILAGTGTVNRAVLLGAGGIIRPGSASPGSTLTAATLTWNGGGALAIDLTSGNRLVVAGALNRGSGGTLHVELAASVPPAVGTVVTLATFASTDAVPGDFTYSGLPIAAASSSSVPRASRFSSPAPDRRPRTPTGPIRRVCRRISRERHDDPDNDGLVNLLEFVLARDPLQTNVSGIIATTVVVDGQRFPAVTFVRRLDLGGVTFGVLTSADLAFASLLGGEQVSATAIDVGLEQVVIRSLVPLAQRPNQFFRLAATLPIVPAEAIVTSSPVGVMSRRMDRGLSGLAVPLISADHFVGVVTSNTATSLAFSPADGSIGSLLAAAGKYYVEVVTGPLAGERFDVDTAATMASNDATLTVTLGPGSLSTLPVLTTDALAGGRCVLRSHLTLSRLQQMLTPGLVGRDNLLLADGVDVLENGRARTLLPARRWRHVEQGRQHGRLPRQGAAARQQLHARVEVRRAGLAPRGQRPHERIPQEPGARHSVVRVRIPAGPLASPDRRVGQPWRSRGDALDGQQRVRVRRSDSGAPGRAEAVGALLSARQRLDVAAARRHHRRRKLSDPRRDEPDSHPPRQCRRGVPHSAAVCAVEPSHLEGRIRLAVPCRSTLARRFGAETRLEPARAFATLQPISRRSGRQDTEPDELRTELVADVHHLRRGVLQIQPHLRDGMACPAAHPGRRVFVGSVSLLGGRGSPLSGTRRRRRRAVGGIVRRFGNDDACALLEEGSGDHSQVGGRAERLTVRSRFGREFEAPRLGLARLPPVDGDGLVRVEHPLARAGRGCLTGIDGVEAIDRQRHGDTDGVGVVKPNGIFPSLERLDVPAPAVGVALLRSAAYENLYTPMVVGQGGHHGLRTEHECEAGDYQSGDVAVHTSSCPLERGRPGILQGFAPGKWFA